MWVGLYRQIPAPLAIFPLFAVGIGLGVNGIWWGLSVVNWSAALFILYFALRLLRLRGADTRITSPAGSEATTLS